MFSAVKVGVPVKVSHFHFDLTAKLPTVARHYPSQPRHPALRRGLRQGRGLSVLTYMSLKLKRVM